MHRQNTPISDRTKRKNKKSAPRDAHFPEHQRAQNAQLSRRQRPQIRTLLSRQLWPPEVDFLLAVWSAGHIRAADCPQVAASLLQRGWIERDGPAVRLSDETLLLLAENVE